MASLPSNIECEYCKKTFSARSNFLTHQKTAKYCIELQGKQATYFECKYCKKKFTSHQNQIEHSCKERERENILKKQQEYEEKIKSIYDLKVRELQTKIDELHDKMQERDLYHQKDLKVLEEKIQEKNEYIAKLESRLDKFENAVTTMATEPKTTNFVVSTDSNDDSQIPIPLHEQMSSIVIEEVEEEIEYTTITLNNVVISSRPLDHYVNATQLCKAGGKKFNHWFSLESTNELIKELSSDAGITASLLVESNRGQTSKFIQGSWIHPDLSIQLAQWISPKFAIQISQWVRTLFNKGSLEIDINILREKERNTRIKDHRIKQLENVCLSKQRRVEYPEKNVIYIITTDDHAKRRTYIIGKAKNLTNRLSTYNKTCDHTVVHHRECKNEDDMDTVETMVLSKLRDYREQANRDRFILPENKNVSFFTDIVDECIRFVY
jgi:hypothetical protein